MSPINGVYVYMWYTWPEFIFFFMLSPTVQVVTILAGNNTDDSSVTIVYRALLCSLIYLIA